MTRIDTILRHVKTWNENMTKYSKIWANGTWNVCTDDKVIPWIASSKSIDQKKPEAWINSRLRNFSDFGQYTGLYLLKKIKWACKRLGEDWVSADGEAVDWFIN